MPVIRQAEGVEYETHGVRFTSYACTKAGSTQLAAWGVRLPARQPGVEHRISGEEVFLVRDGAPRITVDGVAAELSPGDVVIAPAGCLLHVCNPGSQDADLWVTTGSGLSATLPDGSELAPPWAQ